MNKTKTNLGKIIFSLMVLTNLAFASVTASVDKTEFEIGDEIVIKIEAIGNDIKFPEINSIGTMQIEKTERYTQNNIDSSSKSLIRMNYHIKPRTSIVLPEFIVRVDGKDLKTKPINIVKKEIKISSDGNDLGLFVELSKNKIYVGEPISATVFLKYKSNLNLIKSEIEPLRLDNFDIVERNQTISKKDDFEILKIDYILTPQKSGIFELESQLAKIAHKDERKYFTIRKKIYSKAQTIEVLPLPNGIKLLGDFTLKITTDKTKIEPNKPVNATIEINGFGNINEIEPFYIELENIMSHNSKPTIEIGTKNSKFIQKISIISESDFEIPAFELKFFNPNSNSIETISTKPIKIKVEIDDKEMENIQTLQTPQVITIQQTKPLEKFFYIIAGLLAGIFTTFVVFRFKKIKQKVKKPPIFFQIKSTKNDRQLYNLLLPFANNENIKKHIELLEQNLYRNQKNKIDKKSIYCILENII